MVDYGIHPVKEGSDAYKKGFRFYFIRNRRLTKSKRNEPVFGKTKSELTVDKTLENGTVQIAPYRQYVNELNA